MPTAPATELDAGHGDNREVTVETVKTQRAFEVEVYANEATALEG